MSAVRGQKDELCRGKGVSFESEYAVSIILVLGQTGQSFGSAAGPKAERARVSLQSHSEKKVSYRIPENAEGERPCTGAQWTA